MPFVDILNGVANPGTQPAPIVALPPVLQKAAHADDATAAQADWVMPASIRDPVSGPPSTASSACSRTSIRSASRPARSTNGCSARAAAR